MIMTITSKRNTVRRSSFKIVSRVCFFENLQGVNLLFWDEKMKCNHVFQARRKHYFLSSSNSGIKKFFAKY